MKAGRASPKYRQFMSLAADAIIAPTIINVQPVAHGGMEAKIGAKKIEMKKQRPVTTAVIPVLPPSEIPAPDSMNAVTGETPKRDPMEIPRANSMLAGENMTVVMGTDHLPNKQQQNPRNLASQDQLPQRNEPLRTKYRCNLRYRHREM